MKTNTSLIAISIMAIAAVSVLNSNTSSSLAVAGLEQTGISMQGHIELVATDAQGNVKAYVQTDNAIVDEGTECILEALFSNSTGCSPLAGTMGAFTTISLGNVTQTGEDDDVSAATWTAHLETSGLDDAVKDATPTAGGNGTAATIVVEAAFTHSGTFPATVTNALLSNSTAGAGGLAANSQALAFQSFTSIPLDPSDSLTINWTVAVAEG